MGNDRGDRLPFPGLQTTWPDDLAALGYPPAAIDAVVCTHLHFDHVGWHTRLDAGRWVPTFPEARHLVVREEWEHWKAGPEEPWLVPLHDTLDPVAEAGLLDLVPADHVVAPGVRLEPTPGHTPGQVAVVIESVGEWAVITGDVVHHPLQFTVPGMASAADHDAVLAAEARRVFVRRYADTGVLVIGTHFPGPTAGHLVTRGGEVRFVPLEES
ncbi:MBL fold metallo-hydrolase [Yinghuangia soli]|uniref:MBL fold metallo-hydrolase n=1 Tax=Yinghuangia soli TaxID=2908204 RepID=A0AA41Q353_9ACTN|nr:MBL fold metallo-hydrolase [Yinghuangia soli]MCF2530693.1 MBL fold metallo-hydrolase [Yinghuangia soli]